MKIVRCVTGSLRRDKKRKKFKKFKKFNNFNKFRRGTSLKFYKKFLTKRRDLNIARKSIKTFAFIDMVLMNSIFSKNKLYTKSRWLRMCLQDLLWL